jgi:hypothetical protein
MSFRSLKSLNSFKFPKKLQVIKDLNTFLVKNGSMLFINNDLFSDFELALKYNLYFKQRLPNLKVINKLDDESKGSIYFILSEYYLSKNNKLFSSYAEKSAKLNNKWGLYNMALNLWINKDYNQSFSYYQKSADMNNPMAYCDVAECYYTGKGVDKNINKSIEYFSKYLNAINNGEIINVGDKYSKIPKDIISKLK